MNVFYEDRIKASTDSNSLLHFPLQAAEKTNFNFPGHWHNEIEIMLVLKGSILVKINSNAQIMQKNDIFFCNTREIHFYNSTDRKSKILIVVFDPILIDDVLYTAKNTFLCPFIKESILINSNNAYDTLEQIKSCFYIIQDEMKHKNTNYEIIVKGYIYKIIGLFLRHVPKYINEFDYYNVSTGVKAIARSAINYIANNYKKNISLEDVSRYLGYSPYYFSRIFNKITGVSFRTYLNIMRVANVSKIISSNSKTITDAAFECGFSSLRTFNRAFKSIKGDTPSTFVKNLK